MSLGPDFICIGAPKSGTTWLYQNLNKHPSIWLPPVKELHYFDVLFPLPRYAERKYNPKGLCGLFTRYRRQKIIGVLNQVVHRGSMKELMWAYRYFSGDPDNDWYLSLFKGTDGVLTGDLTTDYCALSDEAVSNVKDLLPDAKIIFLMRNPVERAWSHAKMLLPGLLGKRFDEISNDELVDYLSHPAPQLRGDYPRTLGTWEKIYDQQQIFTGFFEEVAESPRQLYIRLLNFLDVSADEKFIPESLEQKVNVGKAATAQSIPDPVRVCLRELYQQDLVWLADRYGGYASKWLDEEGE